MASTKSVVLLLCFLFAVALLITSEVSAEEAQKVEEQGYGGRYGGGYGHGGRYGGGHGHGGGYGHGGYGHGHGGYGHGGGHGRGGHGHDETNNEVAAEVDANTHA